MTISALMAASETQSPDAPSDTSGNGRIEAMLPVILRTTDEKKRCGDTSDNARKEAYLNASGPSISREKVANAEIGKASSISVGANELVTCVREATFISFPLHICQPLYAHCRGSYSLGTNFNTPYRPEHDLRAHC
ncbi:hypothetical protein ABVK25_010701 [Lepraria finkii]|uniref:Uncharacterized protein n=1 Tax=Lepraria finkii TaxID=1340010 RepID=A0ABR4AU68_9LECA